ncbi:amino acid adenylation domain-containing protein [Streptomyces sp. NPDC021093]|uniref:amino acid adenylation domain-containing protein n=1 Tax=Streptomyces sp. NPDC021093 TaxID=3365112 RepID=UPI0037B88B2D
MNTHAPHPEPALGAWEPLLGESLGSPARLPDGWTGAAFGELGGSSLQAYHLVALGERRLGRALDLTRLLSAAPLGEVLARTVPADDRTVPAAPTGDRPLLHGQAQMLSAHLAGRDAAYRLMFSVTAPALDVPRVDATLQALAARHESLRTRFTAEGDEFGRRVLPQWRVPLRELELAPGGGSPAERMESLVAPVAERFLRPFEQPPWCAFVGRSPDGGDVLGLVFHHTIADGWSIGVLLREFAEHYGTGRFGEPLVVPPDHALTRYRTRVDSGLWAEDLRRVAERLTGAPTSLRLPAATGRDGELFDPKGTRLPVVLTPEVRDAVETVAQRAGVRRPVVLMAAWALVLGRRTGVDDLVLGMPASGRFRANQFDAVGLLTRVAPVRVRPAPGTTVEGYLHETAADYAAAVRDSEVPFQDVVLHLDAHPQRGSNALSQFAFAAHDELVPATLDLAGTRADVAEGHCRGAVFDAILYLRRWGSEPTLALEYSDGLVGPQTAAALAGALLATLLDFARMPGAPVDGLTGLSAAERTRLTPNAPGALDTAGGSEDTAGGSEDTASGSEDTARGSEGLWDRFVSAVERRPGAVAVTDPAGGHSLTYRQLEQAAVHYASVLRRAGAGAGGRVLVQVERSAAEIVAVLAVLRLGAGFVPVPQEIAGTWRDEVIRATGASVVVTSADRRGDWPEQVRPVAAWEPGEPVRTSEAEPEPCPRAADSTTYVSFTSGTTGTPKGVEVPDRAVIRLADDPGLLRPADDEDPGRRRVMLRLAPLAFDASTLELFHPLLNGDRVAILPPGPASPRAIRSFLRAEGITHAWLTAGVFRLVSQFEPDSLGVLRQLLTGGDVVSADHVRTVLEACPGLWVTNGYGPTENTTFTTVHHVTSAEAVGDTVPIGRPVAGTGVLVVDGAGRPVPPGVEGELYATGLGLAHGYAGDPGRTASAFVPVPALSGERAYATGDIVCWDDAGQLLFRGRRDRQIKVRGHRVEPAAIEAHIRSWPGVVDVDVSAVGADHTDRAILASVVGPERSALQELVPTLASAFPSYAQPDLWCLVPALPLSRNGKVDTGALAARATATARFLAAAPERGAPGTAVVEPTDPEAAVAGPTVLGAAVVEATAPEAAVVEAPSPSERAPAEPAPVARDLAEPDVAEAVADVWRLLLDDDGFHHDEAFFDAGGDSLQLTAMRNALRERFPGIKITSVDIYRAPTVNKLAAHIRKGLRSG